MPRRRTVIVNDKMQKRLSLRAQRADRPRFRSRVQARADAEADARLGVFGGKYMTDCRKEFPADWFARAKLAPNSAIPLLNFFGVDASQPLSVWRHKGWIHADDPRGWFQWYCRYYMGRRMPDEDAGRSSAGGDPPPRRAGRRRTASRAT